MRSIDGLHLSGRVPPWIHFEGRREDQIKEEDGNGL